MTSDIICHFNSTQLNFIIQMMVVYFNRFKGHFKQFLKTHYILIVYQIPDIHNPF